MTNPFQSSSACAETPSNEGRPQKLIRHLSSFGLLVAGAVTTVGSVALAVNLFMYWTAVRENSVKIRILAFFLVSGLSFLTGSYALYLGRTKLALLATMVGVAVVIACECTQ